MSGKQEITVHEDRKVLGKALLSAVIMDAACLMSIGLGIFQGQREFLLITAGILGIAVFGFCTILFVYRYFSRQPVLRISSQGIRNTHFSGGVDFIPWSKVQEISLVRYRGQARIGIYVYDSDSFRGLMPPIRQKVMDANMAAGFPPFLLQIDGCTQDYEDVLSLLQGYYSDYQERELSYTYETRIKGDTAIG